MTWGFGRTIGSQLAKDLMKEPQPSAEDIAIDAYRAEITALTASLGKQADKLISFEYSGSSIKVSSKKAIAMVIKLKSMLKDNSPADYDDNLEYGVLDDGSGISTRGAVHMTLVGVYESVADKYREMQEFYEATEEVNDAGLDGGIQWTMASAHALDSLFEVRAQLDEWASDIASTDGYYEPYND